MQVTVTQEDIRRGRPHSSVACPIALAASRAFGSTAHVGIGCVVISGVAYLLPDVAEEFARAIDYREAVEPIEFDITEVTEEEPTIIAREYRAR